MPGKFKCPFSKEELQMIYDSEGMTIKKMCGIVGCKSDITIAKILKENGIDTNNNKRVAFSKRGNRSDDEFKSFLVNEYLEKKRSMTNIAKELGVATHYLADYFCRVHNDINGKKHYEGIKHIMYEQKMVSKIKKDEISSSLSNGADYRI